MKTTKTVNILHYEDLMDGNTEAGILQKVAELFDKVPDKYRETATLTREPDPWYDDSYDLYVSYKVPLTPEEIEAKQEKDEEIARKRKNYLERELAAMNKNG